MTDSELTLMVWLPVKMAVSAMVIEEEKLTGAFGPAWILGRMDRRLEDIVLDELGRDVDESRSSPLAYFEVLKTRKSSKHISCKSSLPENDPHRRRNGIRFGILLNPNAALLCGS